MRARALKDIKDEGKKAVLEKFGGVTAKKTNEFAKDNQVIDGHSEERE